MSRTSATLLSREKVLMSINTTLFLSTVLLSFLGLLPSLVAILTVFLTNRNPGYIQSFALCAGWVVAVALFVAAAVSLPWSDMDTATASSITTGIVVVSIIHVFAAVMAGLAINDTVFEND